MMAGKEEFTKYERSRIIGARGLQISMDAPVLLDLNMEELEELNYDPLKIAEKELDFGVLPISVNRPMPKKTAEAIEKVKVKESTVSDEEKEKAEQEAEQEIAEGGEIMGLTDSEEEFEAKDDGSSESEEY